MHAGLLRGFKLQEACFPYVINDYVISMHGLQALVSGASMHVDPSVRKICVQILNMLTCQWLSSLSDTASWEIFPGFRHWVVDHIAIDTCIIGILQGGLDLQVRLCFV